MGWTAKKVECSCEACAKLCQYVPGTPTMKEARKLADMGLMERLSLREYTRSDGSTLPVLIPAFQGRAGREFSVFFVGTPCTFLTHDDKCEIHAHKPAGCAHAVAKDCTSGKKSLRWGPKAERWVESVHATWDTEEGRELVEQWKKQTGNQ